MALTFTNALPVAYRIHGAQKKAVYSVLFDSSYLSGGETVTAANFGLNKIESGEVIGLSFDGSQTVNVASANYDKANGVIHLWNETPAEVTSTNDVSGTTVRFVAYGT